MFVAPNWFEGLLIQVGIYIVIPLIIAIIAGIVIWKKSNHKEPHHDEPHQKESHHRANQKEPNQKEPNQKESHHRTHHKRSNHWGSKFLIFALAFVAAVIVVYPLGCVYWFNAYEIPSVQEKIITVQGWEPRPGIIPDNSGMMTISNAEQLLLVTTENEGFFNRENFLFGKFNTRDIFNQLKVGGTYKIKYYGWRNGFNSGFPNILSVEQVVDETGAKNSNYGDYFGIKFAR
jgi:Protein of unknown function (DUF1523).